MATSREERRSLLVACLVLTLTGVTAFSGLMAFTAEPASAACAAPSLTSSATTVTRGETITVKGSAWATACNDVNPKPNERAGGPPRNGITIVLLQGGHRTVLARGDANHDYAFSVTVAIPSTLLPGTATLAATPGSSGAVRPVTLTISDSPPIHATDGSVATFDTPLPANDTSPSASDTSPDNTMDSGQGKSMADWWILGPIAAAAIAAAIMIPKLRRTR